MSAATNPTPAMSMEELVKSRIDARNQEIRREVIREILTEKLVALGTDPKSTVDSFLSLLETLDAEMNAVATNMPLSDLSKVFLKDYLKANVSAPRAFGTRAPRGSRAKASEELIPKLLEYVNANRGLTVGQIAKGMALPESESFALKSCLRSLVTGDAPKLRKEGEKRSSRYFPVNAPTSAPTPAQ